jgi:hypothetical protein
MYAVGLGVDQSNALAYMWYDISIANGGLNATGGRDRIANRMTPAEISAAQAMARSCVQTGYDACQ